MKKIACILMVAILILANNNVAYAQTETAAYHVDDMREKFKEIFPEYEDKIDECDAIAERSKAGIALMSAQEDNESVIDSITRFEGDDSYTLTFYSDGGYSEVAVLSEDVNISFSYGTEYSTYYTNCRVTTYISDPGLITYTGGMIGDSIAFYKSGTFYNQKYGSYINTGVQPGYDTDVAFVSRTSNEVIVQGVATGVFLAGDYTTVVTKNTALRIKLNANAAPTVEFGYLNDIV